MTRYFFGFKATFRLWLSGDRTHSADVINNLKHAGQKVSTIQWIFKTWISIGFTTVPCLVFLMLVQVLAFWHHTWTHNESSNSVKLVGGDLARKARKTNLVSDVSVCQRGYTDVLQVYCRRKRRKNEEELEKIGNRKPWLWTLPSQNFVKFYPSSSRRTTRRTSGPFSQLVGHGALPQRAMPVLVHTQTPISFSPNLESQKSQKVKESPQIHIIHHYLLCVYIYMYISFYAIFIVVSNFVHSNNASCVIMECSDYWRSLAFP